MTDFQNIYLLLNVMYAPKLKACFNVVQIPFTYLFKKMKSIKNSALSFCPYEVIMYLVAILQDRGRKIENILIGLYSISFRRVLTNYGPPYY